MDDIIRVSFKKSEKKLYDDIMLECSIIGQSAWMKLAAKEKLERDKQPINKTVIPTVQITSVPNVNDTPQKQVNKMPIIDELSELFKS